MSGGQKAKYWCAVGYLENMRTDWQEEIAELLEVPFAYCIHDRDLLKDGSKDKDHVHIIVAFNNTTTYNNALNLFRRLNDEGKQAFNKCEQIVSIRNKYDYLIHDTDDARKKKKYQYGKDERIEGNNFDIGHFEQISIEDKKQIRLEISQIVIEKKFTNYYELYVFILENYDSQYEDILCSYSGHFERLTKGYYNKLRNEDYLRNKIRTEEASKLHEEYTKLKIQELKSRCQK